MGENESHMAVLSRQADQQVFPLHDQFVGGNIVADVAAARRRAVDGMSALLVDAEITCMGGMLVDLPKIFLIRIYLIVLFYFLIYLIYFMAQVLKTHWIILIIYKMNVLKN